MDEQLLLVSVGTDFHHFDRLIDWVDGWLADHQDLPAVIQHGTARPPKYGKAVDNLPYNEFQELMGQTSIVVCHGGTIIAECLRIGIVPIVVPKRHDLVEAVDDAQISFARRLAAAGTIVCCETEMDLHRELSRSLEDATSDQQRPSPREPQVPPPGIERAGRELDQLMAGRRRDRNGTVKFMLSRKRRAIWSPHQLGATPPSRPLDEREGTSS